MNTRSKVALAMTGVAAGTITFAAPAQADVETRGACSSGSTWEADLERDFNVYGMDFEVKTQTANEPWRLVVTHNGKRVLTNTRSTFQEIDDRYADVDWEIVRPDRKGVSDRFTLTATNTVTGEVCKTTLRG